MICKFDSIDSKECILRFHLRDILLCNVRLMRVVIENKLIEVDYAEANYYFDTYQPWLCCWME